MVKNRRPRSLKHNKQIETGRCYNRVVPNLQRGQEKNCEPKISTAGEKEERTFDQ